jgi:hypothetical protein
MMIGCASRQDVDCPDGLTVDTSHMDQAVRAEYKAEQTKDRVIIHAKGELPAGYEGVFVRAATQIYPPEFTLMRHRMHGEYRALQHTFDSCVAFKLEGPVTSVTVHDADGPHQVRVGR